MKKIAISIGDLNGIGLQIALQAHKQISNICKPIYCINENMLLQGAKKLGIKIPFDFDIASCMKSFTITKGVATSQSGQASYDSFIKAFQLTKMRYTSALVTLPINKEAWSLAGIKYKGHTDALSDLLHENAIMMLGCENLFVALYTHHIRLKDVPYFIDKNSIKQFLINVYNSIKSQPIGVLGLNPHAGDGGVIGDEEIIINKALKEVNKELKKDIFLGPLVPDTAFSKKSLKSIKYFICMYHDQGLAPLKALYFDESINVSLNLSILRTSVDHGTAYDIAYKKEKVNLQSYINAIKYATRESD